MGILLSLFFGFVPLLFFAWIVYWLDRYEKEPVILLGGVFLWGAIVAAGGAFLVNTLLGLGVYFFTQSEITTELTTGTLIAPVVEESLKGFAVLMIYLVFRHEFDSVLDGIVYAGIAALGFAATENAFYIYQYGFRENGYQDLLWLVFVRVILVGWQHPFYTAFTGIGLAVARLNRSLPVKFFTPLIGLSVAIFAHSLHNTLTSVFTGAPGLVIGTFFDWTGWFFMALAILWAIWRESGYIRNNLQEEVSNGLITPEQYRIACSSWAQNGARLNALAAGHYSTTNRFYQTCAKLAHKKQLLLNLGEVDNAAAIAHLKEELADLGQRI